MSWHTRLKNVFRAEQLSDELDSELAFHLAETADSLTAQGMPKREAERQAKLRFGNYSVQKERTRDMNIAAWLDAIRADVLYGYRQLRTNPGFAAVAVLSLALGIGANTAIFQLLDAVRLRGLPVQDPSQLMMIARGGNPNEFVTAGPYLSREQAFTYPQIDELRKRQQAFSDVLTFWPTQVNLSASGRSRYAEALFVSSNFLDLLGVKPMLGTGLSAESDKAACSSQSAVVSYGFWQRELGGDANVPGKTISLDGHSFTIAAVTPPSFFGLEPGQRFDVALPLCASNTFAKDGKGHAWENTSFWLTAIGRLKPGWTAERAAQHVAHLSPAIFRATLPAEYQPDLARLYLKNKLTAVSATAGISSLGQRFSSPLWILLSITGAVLLIACANLANLLLARASVREREIALRQAVGASRLRLVMQLLTESLLLAIAGTALGMCVAQVLSRALVAFLNSQTSPIALPVGLNWHVFGFLTALTLTTCILFGLAPALRASDGTPANAMRGSRTSTSSRERNGLRRALVVAQVALSLVLLVAAVLFSRSLQKLLGTKLGFDSHNVLVATVSANGTSARVGEAQNAAFRDLKRRLDSIAAASSVAEVTFTPLGGFGWNESVHADSDRTRSGGKTSWFNRAGPRYFATMGTPLLSGRDFNRHDVLGGPKVALVNQAFARRFFAGANPVGRTFRTEVDAGQPDNVYEVAGLVGDTRYNDLREPEPPIVFLPEDQDDQPSAKRTFVIRGRGPLDLLESSIQREVKEFDANLVIDFRVLDEQIQASVLRERLMANLSVAFGILAACLSTVGLYGMMSYLVLQRRNEIGVRLALGATRGNIYRLIAKDAALMVATGLLLGVVASLFLSRYAESLLFQVKGSDPITLAIAGSLLATTAAIATALPARRAAHGEPARVLCQE